MTTARAYVRTPFLQIRKQGSEGVSNSPKVTQLLGDVARVRMHSPHFRPRLFALPLRVLKSPVGESELEKPLADK